MKREWKHTLLAAALTVGLGLPTVSNVAFAADRDVPEIVSEAKVVKESNDAVSFKLPEHGQVWLYDATSKKTLHSIDLKEGNTYGFNTRENRIYVNEKEGPRVDLDRDHTYRIYYVTANDRDERNRGGSRADRDRNDRDRADRNDRDRSSNTPSSRVPDTAKVVAEGRDEEMSYKAREDGVAYLWDNTNSKLLNTFNLRSGDRLTVSPRSNAVAVNEKTIKDNAELSRKVEYRVLFDVGNTR